MKPFNIVLFAPEIPQNTGTIGRLAVSTDSKLHLIEPLGFSLEDKFLKRAGLDYWHLLDISYYDSSEEFFSKNSGPFFYFTTKARHVFSEISYPDGAYIVFGREDAGLPESLLYQNEPNCVRLPMLAEARSLNLSNTVAVAAYEVLRQWGYPALSGEGRLRNYTWKD